MVSSLAIELVSPGSLGVGILRRIGTLVGIDQSMRKRISKAKHNGCDNEDKIFSQSGSLEFTL